MSCGGSPCDPASGADARRDELARELRARLSRRSALPISFAEERLWCLDQVDAGSLAFVMAAAGRIAGPLRPELLAEACRRVALRQEILRTGFEAAPDGRPRRRLSADSRLAPEVVEMSGVERGERRAAVVRRGNEELTRPFDLARPPLLRLLLLRFDPEDWGLIAIGHHIVFDHWSTRIFHREVMAHYEGLVTGDPVRLPRLPIQYVDFAGWQRRTLVGERLDSLVGYWKGRLAGAPLLALPYDRPCSGTRTYNGRRISRPVPESSLAGLKRVSSATGATLFMVEVAAFAMLLRELCGQPDILIGCDIANRDRPETESLIGFFVGQLPLRLDLSSCRRVSDVVSLARSVALDAYAHAELPFERMVAAARRERDSLRPPLFQVKISQSRPDVPFDSRAGLEITPIEIAPSATELELTLILEEAPTGFVATFEHNRDLFDPPAIERLLDRLLQIVEKIGRDPDALLEAPQRRAPAATSTGLERYYTVRERLRSGVGRPPPGPRSSSLL
jgi:hypothetical protein